MTFEDAATATGLRKASDREGTLRVVSIDGVDRSACGGTHVRSTAEIGVVLVRSVEKIRKATRVEFVCGARADSSRAARLRVADADRRRRCRRRSTTRPPLVTAQAERLKEGDNARKKLEKELATFRARERYDAATPDERGVRTVVIRDAASMDELRHARAGGVRVAARRRGRRAREPAVGAASRRRRIPASTRDVCSRSGSPPLGGRGGGSPRLAQGSVPDAPARSTRSSSQLVNRG